METKIQITPQNSELIIREGKALDPVKPSQYVFSGTIFAPSVHYLQRKDVINPIIASVEVQQEAGIITLKENPRDPLADVITGQLEVHPFLVTLGVNTNKSWTPKSLLEAVRFQFQYFEAMSGYRYLISSLSRFSFEVKNDTDVAKERGSGKVKDSFEANIINSSMGDNPCFYIKTPLYVGMSPEVFRIDIQIEPDGGSVKFYLASEGLMERQSEAKDELIVKALKDMADLCVLYH